MDIVQFMSLALIKILPEVPTSVVMKGDTVEDLKLGAIMAERLHRLNY